MGVHQYGEDGLMTTPSKIPAPKNFEELVLESGNSDCHIQHHDYYLKPILCLSFCSFRFDF